MLVFLKSGSEGAENSENVIARKFYLYRMPMDFEILFLTYVM